MNNIRQQLTLFPGKKDTIQVEQVRQEFNPVQYGLIDSHITLCREDEIEKMKVVLANLRMLDEKILTVHLGKPTRFDNGKGVLLPSSGDNKAFHELWKKILQGTAPELRKHEPHLTLLHPRNATCTDEIFNLINRVEFPSTFSFHTIHLIEQRDGGKWKVIDVFRL